jgi:Distinct helicase family with a unique C-terminal domain including a metal-binding cysteine cluster
MAIMMMIMMIMMRKEALYSHQVKAIEAVLDGKHTLVCTGTGSGKSMCFLLPILAQVMKSDMAAACEFRDRDHLHGKGRGGCTAIIMYPTKALAQDQLTKLLAMVRKHPLMEKHIRPGVIDGDVSPQLRGDIVRQSNILLSNPDTLHAAIIPQWKNPYRDFLSRLRYVVIDELHTYEGAFGAHVSLVLSRLIRVSKVAQVTSCRDNNELLNDEVIFIGCSATIGHPEDYFRLLCPIMQDEEVVVVAPEDDGSPCAAKVKRDFSSLRSNNNHVVYHHHHLISWLFVTLLHYKALYCLEPTSGG